jgi:phage pi2 protein 07
MKMLISDEDKQNIVMMMEENPGSGYFASEIADAWDFNAFEVHEFLTKDSDFFYDDENQSYTGWRLTKYRTAQ